MNVMGYIASPRKNGNTAWTVNKILEGAQEHGAATEVWYAGELDIRPCQACMGCVKSDRCVLNDDMQKLYAALKQADALVLGAPLYMGQMSAQAKAFTDRLSAQISPRFSPRFKEENAGKKLILAFTQGNPDAGKFQTYYDYTKQMFQLLEFDVKDLLVVAGTRSDSASEQDGLDVRMKTAGSTLVSE
ncbi:flavodoxin family protein [Ethanoligenens sp.]|uniref:flavodoxin family protein n=1 Tax=Ethanoligenens sp. TaxID=2099655 RepID=UPI0039EC5423